MKMVLYIYLLFLCLFFYIWLQIILNAVHFILKYNTVCFHIKLVFKALELKKHKISESINKQAKSCIFYYVTALYFPSVDRKSTT
jgi:hypothetical protein